MLPLMLLNAASRFFGLSHFLCGFDKFVEVLMQLLLCCDEVVD